DTSDDDTTSPLSVDWFVLGESRRPPAGQVSSGEPEAVQLSNACCTFHDTMKSQKSGFVNDGTVTPGITRPATEPVVIVALTKPASLRVIVDCAMPELYARYCLVPVWGSV